MSEKCPILPNWMTRKDGKCKRFVMCRTQGRTKESGCIAKGDV